MTQDARRPFIVVGIDGSACSRGALRWAAHQADVTGAELQAVMAWSLPEIYAYESRDFEGETREALRSAVEETLGEQPPVAVTERVVEGHAAQALVAASRGAELLVVGCRGHGGFKGMLLGSVGQRCVAHAPCTVVVVRPPDYC